MPLTSSHFFKEVQLPSDPFLPSGPSTTEVLDVEVLQGLRAARDPEHADVDVAIALMDLVHDELMRFGTGGGELLDDNEMREAIRTLEQVTDRCGQPFTLPFRDHSSWKSWWLRYGAYNSYQARRDLLSDLFDQPTAKLVGAQNRSLESSLADSVSPYDVVGWPRVDTELGELRRHFRDGRTPQDYRAVGNDCVHVLEALSQHVYKPEVHTPEGEDHPPVQQTKQRIERYIQHALPGPDNARVRTFARATIALAQQVKHSGEPTRTEAGISADAVILLANMLRRLEDG
jgi:hypothetical protein